MGKTNEKTKEQTQSTEKKETNTGNVKSTKTFPKQNAPLK